MRRPRRQLRLPGFSRPPAKSNKGCGIGWLRQSATARMARPMRWGQPNVILNLPPSCRIVASGHGTGCRSDEGGRWLMGLSQNYWREDETLARKRLELVIVGASASLSRTQPIANVPLRRDIQSSGEIPLLICCRCTDRRSTMQFMVGGSRDPGPLQRQSVVPKRLLIKASGRVSGTIRHGQIAIECGGQAPGRGIEAVLLPRLERFRREDAPSTRDDSRPECRGRTDGRQRVARLPSRLGPLQREDGVRPPFPAAPCQRDSVPCKPRKSSLPGGTGSDMASPLSL